MIRFIAGLFIVVVAVFAAVNFAGNFLLASAMESALGVEVNVKKVQLGLFAQQAGVYGLRVHNPDGFKEDTLASVPEISVQYDLGALLKKQIHIRELRLNLDEITVERNAEGKFNLTELDAMKPPAEQPATREPGSPAEPSERKPSKGPAMDVIIDEVRLSLGRARYVDSSQGETTVREFPLEIRDAILRDVTDPNAVVQQVVIKTMQKVGLNALLPDMGQFSAAFKGEAAKKIGAFAEKVKASFGG